MSRGTKTPWPIEQFIVETARDMPDVSIGRIAQMVRERFNRPIDRRTVGRILKRNGIERLSASANPREPIGRDVLVKVDQDHRGNLLEYSGRLASSIKCFPARSLNDPRRDAPSDPHVKPEDDDIDLHKCLMEHGADEALPKEYRRWKTTAGRLLKSVHSVDLLAISEAERIFDVPVKELSESGVPRLTPTLPRILRNLALHPRRSSERTKIQDRISWDEPGTFRWEVSGDVTENLGRTESEAWSNFDDAANKVTMNPERRKLRRAVSSERKAAQKVDQILVGYRIKQYVPGRCQHCLDDSVQ